MSKDKPSKTFRELSNFGLVPLRKFFASLFMPVMAAPQALLGFGRSNDALATGASVDEYIIP